MASKTLKGQEAEQPERSQKGARIGLPMNRDGAEHPEGSEWSRGSGKPGGRQRAGRAWNGQETCTGLRGWQWVSSSRGVAQ